MLSLFKKSQAIKLRTLNFLNWRSSKPRITKNQSFDQQRHYFFWIDVKKTIFNRPFLRIESKWVSIQHMFYYEFWISIRAYFPSQPILASLYSKARNWLILRINQNISKLAFRMSTLTKILLKNSISEL